ncbi:MAG: hypothetical protein JSW53_04020 [Candidatus Bathyarchaeota archaeon]|nr:MAG: hypothetical protein JSW53_04020 [Candidatus Bathyarchaeota archaeon]
MEISRPQKRVTIDFTLKEVESIGGNPGGKYLRFRIVPDERSWERAEVQEAKGYLNRFDDVFISDEELANTTEAMRDIPISLTFEEVGSEQEYLERSRRRVKRERK